MDTRENKKENEMKNHDGDITTGTNSYYGDDLTADMEAKEIIAKIHADAVTAEERRVLQGTCIKCSAHPSLEAYRAHVMGSGVYCQQHLEEYHKKPLADILEAKRSSDAVVHHCARCGAVGRWISGAGEALCSRHEDDY
jgi:hypothetical protein